MTPPKPRPTTPPRIVTTPPWRVNAPNTRVETGNTRPTSPTPTASSSDASPAILTSEARPSSSRPTSPSPLRANSSDGRPAPLTLQSRRRPGNPPLEVSIPPPPSRFGVGNSRAAPRLAIVILRRDIRLSDNPIFHYFSLLPNHRVFHYLLPLYVFPADEVEVSGFLPPSSNPSPYTEARSSILGIYKTGPHRVKFMAEGVWDLKESLEKLQSSLVIRVGMVGDVVHDILKFYDYQNCCRVAEIWMARGESSEDLRDEAEVKQLAHQYGVHWWTIWNEKYLIDKDDLRRITVSNTPSGFLSQVTSLAPELRILDPLPPPTSLPPLPPRIPPQHGEFRIPTSLQGLQESLLKPFEHDPLFPLARSPILSLGVESACPFVGGEHAAHDRLMKLIRLGVVSNPERKGNALLGTNSSTKLSAYLAQGHISARQIYSKIKGLVKGKNQYGLEGPSDVILGLLLRDYARLLFMKYKKEMGLAYRAEDWRYVSDEGVRGDLQRIFSARTGIALIDASTRELRITGYTSTPLRKTFAVFLMDTLGIDFRAGLEWYASLLVDYDVCSNSVNWYFLKTMRNNHEYDFVPHPVQTSLDYDPEGEYIRAWMPELRHMPWTIARSLPAQPWGSGHRHLRELVLFLLPWLLTDDEKFEFEINGFSWMKEPLARLKPLPAGAYYSDEEVEQMANSEEVEQMASSEEVEQMASSEEVEQMASSEEVEQMASSEEDEQMASSEDVGRRSATLC